MELNLLKEFLLSYSLPTIIIAVAVGFVGFLTEKFINVKIPQFILTYAPFIVAVLLYFAYDMLFLVKAFYLRSESLYAGILSGSLSVIIKETVKKIVSGKPVNLSATTLLIEGLITGYVKNGAITKTAILVENILRERKDEQDDVKFEVATALKNNSDGLDEQDLLSLASLIITSVATIKTD